VKKNKPHQPEGEGFEEPDESTIPSDIESKENKDDIVS
jgi:hypothetical protein